MRTRATVPTFTSPREAARFYLQAGLQPHPVPFRSKRCLLDGWEDLRLAEADLDEAFPADQPLNIGIKNGRPSGNVYDVDLDCAPAVRAAAILLPRTGWIFGRTSRPKSHWLYRAAGDLGKAFEKYQWQGVGTLVELRGTRSQTVYPGSTHEEGEPITWDVFEHPAEIDLALLQKAVAELAACALLAHYWDQARPRNDATLALCGGLLRAGWPVDKVAKFVSAVAFAAHDEEYKRRGQEAARTAEKLRDPANQVTGWTRLAELIGAQGKQVVRQLRDWLGLANETESATALPARPRARFVPRRPYLPFPVDLLPPVLRDLATEGATATGCDPAFIAIPALVTAAGCVGNSRNLQVKRKWREPCLLWGAVVAKSGSVKSGGQELATGSVAEAQISALEAHQQKLEQYEQDLEDWKEQTRKDRGKKPPAPPPPDIFYTSDATIEGVSRLLARRPRGLLLVRDELDAWFASFTRYKGAGGSSDRPHWLEIHRAGVLRVDRADPNKPPIAIRRAAVSVFGTIQPRVLATALDAQARASGLGARLLLVNPPKRKRVWTEADVSEPTVEAYNELLVRLLALVPEDPARCLPHSLQLSPEAKRLWVAFFNEWGEEQYRADDELAAVFAKIEAYCLRLALLLHVVACAAAGRDDLCPIAAEPMRHGIALARWFAQEATRVYELLEEGADERAVRELVEVIRARGGRVDVRGLQQSNAGKYPTKEDAEAALKNLEALGLGRWEGRAGVRTAGRQPAPEFVLDLQRASYVSDVSPHDPEDERDGDGDDLSNDSPAWTPPDSGADAVSPSRESTNGAGGVPAGGETSETYEVGEGESCERAGSEEPRPGPETSDRVPPDALPFRYITAASELPAVLTALDETAVVALDLETTGLDPRTDTVRLLSLGVDTVDGGTFVYLIDCFAVDPAPVLAVLADKDLVAHNALFELRFLEKLGCVPRGRVHDTFLLAKVLTAGSPEFNHCGLDDCAARHLGTTLDKAAQRSDWSGTLTAEQLAYAATDVLVLPQLHAHLAKEVEAAGLQQVADLEQRALRGVAWTAAAGVQVDRGALANLAEGFSADEQRLRQDLDALAPARPAQPRKGQQAETLFPVEPEPTPWNWKSPPQVKQVFALLGVELASSDDDALAGVAHPLAAKLREYRSADKRATSYGARMLERIAPDGRVYADWKQLGTVSGRMSCGEPNLQQVPGDRGYRRCFVAPAGRVLVKADYSQIEVRIVAKLCGDPGMIDAYVRGDDLHTLTARRVLGVEQPTAEDRKIGKTLNLAMMYGMGAGQLREKLVAALGWEVTEGRATELRNAHLAAYPRLRAWHRRQGGRRDQAVTTTTLAGRTRRNVDRYSEKLNTPSQGTGADGFKAALALLWERRAQCPGAFPVLLVHDEIVVECAEGQAERVTEWLRRALLDGMEPLIAPVPVAVDVTVGRTWAGD